MKRSFNLVFRCALAFSAASCGTLLGVDDFEVDPNFQEDVDDDGDDDSEDDDGEDDDMPGFVDDDDVTDDDVTDDDTEDDDTADDDTADDDTEDDDTEDDDTADDDLTDDDIAGDDDADDDVIGPEAGVDDDEDDDITTDDDADDDLVDDDVTPDGSACFAPVSGTCDNLPQCGCGAENCEFDLDDSGGTSCVSAGTRAPYAECTATANQCPVGHSCVGGVCREFCSGEEPTCAQGDYSACLAVNTAAGAEIPGFYTCTRFCDPRNPASETDGYQSCGAGVACLPSPDGFSNCYSASASRSAGQSCAGSGGAPDPLLCAPGLGCSLGLDGTTPTCQPYCEVGTEECGAGAECLPFAPSLFAGAVEMGTCVFCENVPAGGECAYFPQCGCADGEMCYLGATGYAECVPAAERTLNEPCSVLDPCGAGLDCLWLTAIYPYEGVCTQFCQVADDCPASNTMCLNLGIDGANHCLWGCDPRDPTNATDPFTACGANQACVPVTDGDAACIIPDALGAVGAACAFDSECAVGLGCSSYTGCAEWCSPGSSGCSLGTTSCFERYGATAAGVPFGTCEVANLTVTTTDVATAIPDQGSIQSTITAPAMYYPTRVTVEVDIVHTFVGDLVLELRAPDGTLVVLLNGAVLGGEDNLTGTRFDDAGGDVAYGLAPFQGAYQPETPLEVLNGNDIGGVWTLTVTDDSGSDTGTLNSWTLHFW
jgi:subtilisin-like proprotein convertase family protein